MALMASGSLNGLLPSFSALDSHASSGSASRVSLGLAAAATPRGSLGVVVAVVVGRGVSPGPLSLRTLVRSAPRKPIAPGPGRPAGVAPCLSADPSPSINQPPEFPTAATHRARPSGSGSAPPAPAPRRAPAAPAGARPRPSGRGRATAAAGRPARARGTLGATPAGMVARGSRR